MNTPTRIAYSVTAQSTGGRAGRATTTDPELVLDLRAPVELGGPGGGSNPEQLFAMGYGACFQGAMGLVAKDFGLDISESVVRTTIGIGPEGSSFALTAVIEVLVPGADTARVQALADKAHELCPYSKATRGNVPVEVKAVSAL